MKEESWNCRKCNISIDGHNQYLHDRMCDDCFHREYFPEDQAAYEKRVVKIGNKIIDPIGLAQEEFEQELGLTEYIETKEGKEEKVYLDVFFTFLDKIGSPELASYLLYDGEIIRPFDLSMPQIHENLYLLLGRKGVLFSEDGNVTQAFTDKKSFFVIVQEGALFFSGNGSSKKMMADALNERGIDFFHEKTDDF